MLDLALFRKPAFTGAQIVAFSISASMFSMFLYLTLYMQNVLGYSPLQAGPALPAGVGPVVLRRAAGRPPRSSRVPVRVLIFGGLTAVGTGPAPHGRRLALLGVDDPAGRVPDRRRRAWAS